MKPASPKIKTPTKMPSGPLDWRTLLQWLREDALINDDDVERTTQRFGSSHSKQHPLVRLASAGLTSASDRSAFDVVVLTQWLAQRIGLPYLRIDPLKVDVGRVTEVMSVTYAERRGALPIQVGNSEVTIAVCEPFDTAWVPEIEAHTRKTVRLALSNPIDLKRFTTEFYSLARSVRAAQRAARSNAGSQKAAIAGLWARSLKASPPNAISAAAISAATTVCVMPISPGIATPARSQRKVDTPSTSSSASEYV